MYQTRQYQTLAGSLHKLQHNEGPPPDFIIAVEGKEWPVHKLVLYLHSDVLYKMSTNPGFTECLTGRVLLRDVELRCVETMVHFLYHLEYDYSGYPGLGGTPEDDEKGEQTPKSPRAVVESSSNVRDTANVNRYIRNRQRRPAVLAASERPPADNRGSRSLVPMASSQRPEESAAEMKDRLQFHLDVCILAECYNIKNLKQAAEEKIVEEHLKTALECAKLTSVVDTILDSDVPESTRRRVIDSLVQQSQFLHAGESSRGLLDRRPELAVAILKDIVKAKYLQHARGAESKLMEWR